MESSSGTITATDGVRLHYEKFGSGSKTVLVPNGIYLIEDFRQLAEARTVIFYDVRNRGRSQTVTDPARLAAGIENDVDDLDAVRRHFGLSEIDAIGHSYVGMTVALYAMKYAGHARRVVQIGPIQPDATAQYPAHLKYTDDIGARVMADMAQLMKGAPADPEEACRKFWAVLRPLYVADPKDVDKVDWSRCDLPNERNFMPYWMGDVMPSIQRMKLTQQDFAKVTAPVLVVHGTKDRNAAFGGGRDWALRLPDARLLAVHDAAHAPWIEAPDLVLGAICTFLDGAWPEAAEKVEEELKYH
jgi:proline iminopeptidase